MARKSEGAEDGKGLSLSDAMRLGRTRELFFVAGLAKGGSAALVADPRKGGTALFNRAKDQHEGMSRAKSVTGVLTVSGKELDLRVDEAEIPGPLKKAMKKMLKEAGMPMKIIFRLPGGQTEEEGDEDEADGADATAGAGGAEGGAASGGGGDAAPDPTEALRARLAQQVEAMGDDLGRVLAEGSTGAARKAEQLRSMFEAALAGPDPARAAPIAKLLAGFVGGEVARLGKAASDRTQGLFGQLGDALSQVSQAAQAAAGGAAAGIEAGMQGLADAGAALGAALEDGGEAAPADGGAPVDAGRPSTDGTDPAAGAPTGTPSVPQSPDAGAAAPDPSKLSGKAWFNANQAKYPNSKKVDDLSSTFRPKAQKFIAALTAAGAATTIEATLRSRARADLMYYCWQVAKKGMDAATVPAIDGVDIIWDHGDAEKSKKGAQEMYDAFGIGGVVAKPGNSNHLTGDAMDMYISWTGTLKIKNASGEEVTIEGTPTDQTNEKIQEVGATYGCKNGAKTLNEPWHWSPTGN